jgi:hypothetical protein
MLFLLAALIVVGCGSGEPHAPATGVDLETPVTRLSGWDALVANLNLPYNGDQALANWVEVFREGLDIARKSRDSSARGQTEANWWNEAHRSLEAIVGAEKVETVIAWLEGLYGNRGGRS